MIRVKICGITNLADARYASAAGADYVGFVRHAASPRHVTVDVAHDIIEWLYGPEPVGVYLDAPSPDVNRDAERAGFKLVQLHGVETPEDCALVERPVIKAFHVGESTDSASVLAVIDRYRGAIAYALLDTRLGSRTGGTGTAFDWNVAAEIVAGAGDLPVFLAGGLRPENAADAATRVNPFAIDVASGVESTPGIKDYERIEALLDALAPFRGELD
jgi:phosphoribosylanthranilate isomerase